MSRNILILTFLLWSMMLPIAEKASAQTNLTRAVVQNLRNLVRLIPQNRTARPARLSDAMTPGDALSTGRSSLAELRFNDGSLARIGEQAVFRFIAQTRRFRLSNGTVLLLIPPGRGVTGIQTPNAAAAIKGSALFVRYIPETDTTIVGALTDSNIEVSNQSASEREVLEAGQMAVVVNDRIEGLYEFDLNTFYETSDLVQQLNLNQQSSNVPAPADPAIASVRAETAAAAATQAPVRGEGVIENPTFVQSPSSSAGESQPNQGNTSTTPTQPNQGNTSTTPSNTTPSNSTPTNTSTPASGENTNNQQPPSSGNNTTPTDNNTSPRTPIENVAPTTPPLDDVTPVAPPTTNTPPTNGVTDPLTPDEDNTPPTDNGATDPITPDEDNTPPADGVTDPITPVDENTPPTDNGATDPITPDEDNTPPADGVTDPITPDEDNTPPTDNGVTDPITPVDENTPPTDDGATDPITPVDENIPPTDDGVTDPIIPVEDNTPPPDDGVTDPITPVDENTPPTDDGVTDPITPVDENIPPTDDGVTDPITPVEDNTPPPDNGVTDPITPVEDNTPPTEGGDTGSTVENEPPTLLDDVTVPVEPQQGIELQSRSFFRRLQSYLPR